MLELATTVFDGSKSPEWCVLSVTRGRSREGERRREVRKWKVDGYGSTACCW